MRELRPGDRDRRPARQLPGAAPRWPPPPWPTSGRSPTPGPTWSSDRFRARHRGRGPAAAAGAAGPRRGGPALRPLRHRRGRHPGGAAGGGRAVAHRRHPGQPAGLADHGRLAQAHRPAPQRAGPPAPRGQRRPVDAARAVAGARRRPAGGRVRRHAHPAVHVLPPRPVAGVADRADPAGGRRPDHRGDRPGVPGARGDHDPAHQPGQAAHQGQRRAVRHAPRRRARPNGSAPSSTCST